VDVHVWWPKNAATLVSAVKVTDTVVEPTEAPTQAQTETSQPTTEQIVTPPTGVTPGDADCNGEVDILDVISINKAIMGKEILNSAGLYNIDFNQNGKPDSDESMKVLKCIVGMISQNQLFD
ncbi:MAG: dockerin type I repeat-containing protein, partial [Oscillospiraceae bacterium]|nr:dockerin type I repeat-containing protein [Oscillospiraceae bacterium]